MQAYSKTSKLEYRSKILQSLVPLLSMTWYQVLVDSATTFHFYWKHQLHPDWNVFRVLGSLNGWNFHPDPNHKILQNFGDSQHLSKQFATGFHGVPRQQVGLKPQIESLTSFASSDSSEPSWHSWVACYQQAFVVVEIMTPVQTAQTSQDQHL